MEEDVDFVVLWVDGSDPEWQKEKEHWDRIIHPDKESNGAERYRDWSFFHYWFRAVERYAPWVRKVHLVTNGQVPSWLDLSCEKLHLVTHDDLIPEKWLPTFSSSSIDMCLKNIPDLREHFVYFNDDVFLTRPVTKEDFFKNGLPCICSSASPVVNNSHNEGFYHSQFSTIGIVSALNWESFYYKNPTKWFNYRNGLHLINNVHYFQSGVNYGLYFPHVCQPFRKSTMELTWSLFSKEIEETVSHKFRQPTDLCHQLFTYVETFNGDFSPCSKEHLGHLFPRLSRDYGSLCTVIKEQKYLSVCINDAWDVNANNFAEIKDIVCRALDNEFPNSSIYEKSI